MKQKAWRILINFIILQKHLQMQKDEAKTTETSMTSSQINPIKLSYVECPKQGMHYGEVCNMVCV